MQHNKTKIHISSHVCISKTENGDSMDDGFNSGYNCKDFFR